RRTSHPPGGCPSHRPTSSLLVNRTRRRSRLGLPPHPMKTSILLRSAGFALAGLLAVILTACRDPEAVVLWSPDGQLGLVRAPPREALNTPPTRPARAAAGRPAPAPAPGPLGQAGAGSPVPRHALAVREVSASNWDEYATLLGPDRARSAIASADALLARIR